MLPEKCPLIQRVVFFGANLKKEIAVPVPHPVGLLRWGHFDSPFRGCFLGLILCLIAFPLG